MFSISLDSCEIKENEEAAQAIVDQFSDFVSGLGRNSSMSFIEVEHLILERTQELRQKLLELHALDQASVKETKPVLCPTCEKTCRPWRKRGASLRHYVVMLVLTVGCIIVKTNIIISLGIRSRS